MKTMPITCLVALALLSATAPAAHAESWHHCTGFIDTLPATVATPGVWCLRKDVSTTITSGTALAINASNVTIDCNGFRLNGAGATPPSDAWGLLAVNRSNVTLRNCDIRGFYVGAYFAGGSGYLVEHNRATGARGVGLWIDGADSIVRGNRVSDIGAGSPSGNVGGIYTQGDGTLVEANHVSEVTGTADAEGDAMGILINGDGSRARDNYITMILPGSGTAIGIRDSTGPRAVFERNTIVNPAPTTGYGFSVNAGAAAPVCLGNVVRGFTTSSFDDCIDGGGNYGD